MKQVVIENPVLNSPFEEPRRHFRFTEEGITDEVVEARRVSSYFIPIPRPKKKSPRQLSYETEWTADRIEENKFINQVRDRVALWRRGGYVGITRITASLLQYWKNPERERRLFFCQVEALETAIYIAEVAGKYGDGWIENRLRDENARGNPLLYRIAFKMATGSGKTAVMAMLIAWQALNKLAYPQDARFSDTFLIVTPGITIRDRLRVLLPNDPGNYYRALDIVPPDLWPELGKAKILITNFHAFKPRERISAGRLTKELLGKGQANPFTETPGQMVRRACRELGGKRNIVVINDEAHHCYRRRPEPEVEESLTGEERREAQKRDEEARVWISGLEAVKDKIGVKVVYDLSATPFFLRGSGYAEGTLFPWVVSDFSLIDAIESGIVKVPRVPVADDSMVGDQPTYRDLWLRIRDHLPKKGRGTDAVGGEPKLPVELEAALQSLYTNYEKYYRQWEGATKVATTSGAVGSDGFSRLTPPVFIVVCNNTNVSNLVFKHIAGWEKPLGDGSSVLVPGKLALFSNVEGDRWSPRPKTILVDSEQLESGEGMSDEFKRMAAREIEEFKQEVRARFPGRDAGDLTDEDLLREVMNTVGKPGKLGESVKCVVSVSMLSEGWDCLDKSTEILAAEGWRGRGQVTPGDLIYSLNRETGDLELVPVLECGERQVQADERMVRFESQHLDIRVTEGHQLHLKYRDPHAGGRLSRGWITKTASEMVPRRSSYALPLAAEYPSLAGVPLSDDELRLIAWFMTDGGFSGYKLAISQSKPYHVEIRELLTRLNLDYTEAVVEPGPQAYENSKPVHVLRIPKGNRTGSLARNGWIKYSAYLDKSVAPSLHHMTRRQFLVFWEALLKGDGERQGNKAGWLWCSEKAQADAYTRMAVVRGLAASCHPEITATGKIVYRVSARDARWITSDPGDLVLDPTCGSGTTAYVAEQWGRRWITADTSRVAIALARTRLMAGRYPYYLLADTTEGNQRERELGSGDFSRAMTTKVVTTGDIKKGFVYKRVPHITLKSIANNEEIDAIHAKWQEQLEPLRERINDLVSTLLSGEGPGVRWEEWQVPRELPPDLAGLQDPRGLHEEWWQLRRERQAEIDASMARRADTELLYDQPYEDGKRVRVTGPFTVESLSPHRVLSADEEDPQTRSAQMNADKDQENHLRKSASSADGFVLMIIENLKAAGVQNTVKGERLKFDRLESYAGTWIHAAGEYTEAGKGKRVAVCIGPEHGTVGPDLVKEAAKEAVRGVGFDLLVVCGFAFDPHVGEEAKRYGKLNVLIARMNPDLSMGDELLKKTGAANLFMVFGEPDVVIRSFGEDNPQMRSAQKDAEKGKGKKHLRPSTRFASADKEIIVEIRGVDVYDPTTGQIRSSSTDDIACWFVDTDYNGESFFVRHAYFTGANEPYEKLKRALRAEVDEAAWSALYSTRSQPFDPPKTGRIAVKVINHYGDEVMKVYEV